MNLPVRSPDAGFSRPKLAPEIEASYRAQNFDPLEAYYGFRRVKAAFRSGDVVLLARVTRYPLMMTGTVRRTIRNRDQLIAAKKTIMDPHIQEVVANTELRDGLRAGQRNDARRRRSLDHPRHHGLRIRRHHAGVTAWPHEDDPAKDAPEGAASILAEPWRVLYWGRTSSLQASENAGGFCQTHNISRACSMATGSGCS